MRKDRTIHEIVNVDFISNVKQPIVFAADRITIVEQRDGAGADGVCLMANTNVDDVVAYVNDSHAHGLNIHAWLRVCY